MLKASKFISELIKVFPNCRFKVIKPFELKTIFMPYAGVQLDKNILLRFKSVIAYSAYTATACDYHIRDSVTPYVIAALKMISQGSRYTIDKDYCIPRKEVAVKAGLGKIAYNGLFFDTEYGLDCKLDCVFTDLEFEDISEFNSEDYRLDICKECNKNCACKCPVKACGEYKITYIGRCDNLITPFAKLQ